MYKYCKSECEFKGSKNKKLSYRCSEWNKKQLKPINRLIKKFPNTDFALILTSLFCY